MVSELPRIRWGHVAFVLWVPGRRLRWERPAPQHCCLEGLHLTGNPRGHGHLEEPLNSCPAQDLRLRGEDALGTGVPAWWLVLREDQRDSQPRKQHLDEGPPSSSPP